MALTIHALNAFKAKGYRMDTRIKGRKPVNLLHAVFSGFIRDMDAIEGTIRNFIENGAIVQPNTLKGYVFFSYPDSDEGKELFTNFKHELTESGNHLRFIGYSDHLYMGAC